MSLDTKLVKIAENEQKTLTSVRDMNAELECVLYDSANGGKSYYDTFWDALQRNGSRTEYLFGFAHGSWNQYTFKPKYNMQPVNAQQMFYWFNNSPSDYPPVDLVALLDERGVTLDFSKATNLNYCFQNSRISHLGVIDLSSCVNVETTFCNMYNAKTIDKIIVNEKNVFNRTAFANCGASSITFEGVINSDLNLGQGDGTPPMLDKASIKSVFECLSSTAGGKTLTLHSGAVTIAFGSTSSQEWLNLVATKPNWTITLT